MDPPEILAMSPPLFPFAVPATTPCVASLVGCPLILGKGVSAASVTVANPRLRSVLVGDLRDADGDVIGEVVGVSLGELSGELSRICCRI